MEILKVYLQRKGGFGNRGRQRGDNGFANEGEGLKFMGLTQSEIYRIGLGQVGVTFPSCRVE